MQTFTEVYANVQTTDLCRTCMESNFSNSQKSDALTNETTSQGRTGRERDNENNLLLYLLVEPEGELVVAC